MNCFKYVFSSFLGTESVNYIAVNGGLTEPSDFIKNILICVLKMNKGLTGVERYEETSDWDAAADCRDHMEEKLDMDDVSPSHQHQRGLWKSFHGKAKLTGSPKLGKKDRKQESGFWIFKKKRPNGLDRAISSSQPNLPSAALDGGDSGRTRCGMPEQSVGTPAAAAASLGAEIQMLKRTVSSKPTLSQLVQSQHKPVPQGSTCIDDAVMDGNEEQVNKSVGINAADNGITKPLLPTSVMYQLDIVLKRGNNLAIRDRGGTSDPYVKFKIAGKEVFRSKIIHKNLNPVWDERVCLIVNNLQEPLYIKVFDYDFGLQDDFMGSAYLYLESLEHLRPLDVRLDLQDPHCSEQDLGSLELVVTLFPRSTEDREALRQVQQQLQQQNLRLSDLHKKSQLWRGIVSIRLIEGRNLIPMDQNGFSDPYVKFKLGPQKYKSKTIPKTLNPQWREQFDLHLFDEEGGVLEISVWDKDIGVRDDFIGQCQLDLSKLSREKTHKLELELEEDKGTLVLLVTLTATVAVSISDLSVNLLDDPQERQQILKRYSPMRSFFNVKDVGIVQVKILRAEGLMAADVTGKSDPFCIAELCNDRLQTHTVYKTLNPEWNKVFTFNVKDIHSVLEITVYDEDRDRSADFLGKVAIPLLNIRNSEQKAYVLKNKELTGPTKGVIFLEADVIFNAVKASLRTFVPPEQKYIEEEAKVSKQLLQQNFNRVKRCIFFLINVGSYINSCFQWESPRRSLCAFLIFVVVVWNFEIYMIPLSLLLLLTWNYFLLASGKELREGSVQAIEDLLEDVDEECDKDDKDSEKKGFLDKFYAVQDVIITVQNALDEVACFGERVKNTFNWSVPFLSWLAITVLCAGATLIYFIPLRYIVLVWGINKFTKKLRDPYNIENNELLDFLSRVPSDIQMVQYKELKPDSSQSPSRKRRNNPR
ncbi:multiple C2 and transmembrane domain-containing protein 1 isoform X5 [Ctenopharyngodon idella]|uniref:multiple C2 and transmembrane domain-containing protein 1 isoform X5 n=1 Tax=Ctenopharyngodon idella TaxID=7959 RepID=UPI0022311EB0|nr:multiple C2 and transmembrane domain-containing protein 1 isoform X5 [Ctenopharyngodon idella]